MGSKGINRIIVLAIVLVFVGAGIFFLRSGRNSGGLSGGTSDSVTLRVCTWSNYYPENILQDFSKKTGIKVELSYISSNEELFAKMKAGASGFDIIHPSDYMVRQMAALGMLTPLTHEKLTHLNHLDEYYKSLPYDPGLKHSVPFTWGTTGIAINTAKVKLPENGVTWKMLLDSPDGKHTSILDDMREVFSAVLLSQGQSPNTRDEKPLEQAREKVAQVKDKVLMFSSEPKPLLLRGEINIAHIYSSDAVQAAIENPNIKYFIPKEGGIIWTDNFAIPKSSERTAEAHAFINYFLDPENASLLIQQNHLATPNKTAKLRLLPDVANNPNLYPPQSVLSKMVFLEDLGAAMAILNRMWTELKS
jgi:spermidine/putrescine-binding protein